jgi:hypothetical protein
VLFSFMNNIKKQVFFYNPGSDNATQSQ